MKQKRIERRARALERRQGDAIKFRKEMAALKGKKNPSEEDTKRTAMLNKKLIIAERDVENILNPKDGVKKGE